MIVLDDLMDEVTSSPDMEALFVRGMHHRHLTVIYLNQNLFCKGKHSRTINLNTHVLVLMKNPRDVSQIQCLARQSFPGKSKFVMESYKDATSESYGYLVLDFSPKALDDHRVRSKILYGPGYYIGSIVAEPPPLEEKTIPSPPGVPSKEIKWLKF
ncbi:hypothetical protein BOV99_12345 [Solemya velum gill symbiont]|nr:hypothetical protein BOV99_12345 [Solemya velum gill symbiont]